MNESMIGRGFVGKIRFFFQPIIQILNTESKFLHLLNPIKPRINEVE